MTVSEMKFKPFSAGERATPIRHLGADHARLLRP